MDNETHTDLFLKTEQLLYFRLTFTVASLGILLFFVFADTGETVYHQAGIVVAFAFAYSLLGFLTVRFSSFRDDRRLSRLNALLIGLDVLSLSALVHFTRGVESDLYFLYLLPILLSSHTFSRRGIYVTAAAAACAYVTTLVSGNLNVLFYFLEPESHSGLAQAYIQKLWLKIVLRSAILVAVAFIWGAFCDHMSRVAGHGADRLRDELSRNNRLVAETYAQAQREHLINTINSAIRSTLDLDQILKTTVDKLSAALKLSHCAIFCPPPAEAESPCVWQNTPADHGVEHLFTEEFARFVLANKSSFEGQDEEGKIKATFVFDEPIRDWQLREVRDDLTRAELRSLVLQPIMYGLESMGVLVIGECHRRRKWTLAELELVRSVGGQLAVAIEHARLVEQLSRKNKDLIRKNLNLDAKNLELRTMQSTLIHQEKMASLGRMVAGIAHELNNPVNFVHGNLPYLTEYFGDLKKLVAASDDLPEVYKKNVDDLKNEVKYDFLVTDLEHIIADLNEGCERIRQIVRNLRSFSRLDEAELKEASIREGIEATIKILNQYYGRDRIPVEFVFEDIPAVLCYPGQLNQVWMNLLSNAAEAAESVASPVVTVGARVEGSWLVVDIMDNGPGIEVENQSKIFEPFFTTKPVGKGTGLGLSICHSIIERHGGKIWFESQAGEGTTFKVRIPLNSSSKDRSTGNEHSGAK